MPFQWKHVVGIQKELVFVIIYFLGYYLYMEASGQRFGDRARLTSPNLIGQCSLRMFYHMFGRHVNGLVVYMRTKLNGPLITLGNMSGSLGDNWIRSVVNASNGNQPFQVIIEGQFKCNGC